MPPEHARRLHIAGHACGWVTHAAADALRHIAEVALMPDNLEIFPAGTPSPAPDRCMAHVAYTLRNADCLRGWRNELLDVTSAEGIIGKIERAACATCVPQLPGMQT